MSKKERRSVPVLRFKGFTDDWEQRKFGDFWKLKSGKAYKASEYVNKGIPIINGETIKNGEIKSKNLNYLPKRYLLIKDNIILKPDDVVIGLNRPIINNQLKISPIPKNIPVSFLYQRAGKIESKFSNLSTIETYYLLERNIFNFSKITAIGSDQPFIKTSALLSWKFFIPKEIEEKTINKLLAKISTLIFLQQRKLDRLLLLKKAYLTNLLPDKTQNPKVRFKEFNDKWKKLKLGNISSISAGGDVNKQKLLKKGRYPVIANALTNKGVIGYYESEYRIQAPAVTVTGRGDIGHAYARKTNFTPVVRLLSVKSKHNVDFLAEAINQKKVPFESTGVPQLTVPKLSNYKILFPSSITEENKIGNFIIKFDEIINLQNKKISSLEQVKNFLLQNMFI